MVKIQDSLVYLEKMELSIPIIMSVSQQRFNTQSHTNVKPDPAAITNGTIKVLHDKKNLTHD